MDREEIAMLGKTTKDPALVPLGRIPIRKKHDYSRRQEPKSVRSHSPKLRGGEYFRKDG